MPITKQNAVLARETAKNKHYQALVERIDTAIRERFGEKYEDRVHVTTSGTPYGVVKAVMDEYAAAGWTVKHSSDQRDGDFITLS